MAKILSGKELSEKLLIKQAEEVAQLKQKGIVPGLVVILVGEDPASQIYVRNKMRACEKVGIYSETIRLEENTSEEKLIEIIDKLNSDEKINGILVQLPLPRHINEQNVLMRILPEKDVDGFHIANAGKLFTGQKSMLPCTPKGIMYMLDDAKIVFEGKNAVVIGRSNIVGKPIAMLLLNRNCTVTICHSRTQNLSEFTKHADILVAAVGKAKFVTADMVKKGAVVVDVGINRVDGKVVGDVDFEPVSEVAGYITPVPGGVGKMTISMLIQNTIEAAKA
jgi:methylenetetrahydrofolate dehydrogenase (NADP+)/methenyltetrahydrofolate cyclohydrolase